MIGQEVPALVSLGLKAGLFAYAFKSKISTKTTKLFLVLLAFLSLHNVIEVVGILHFKENGLDPFVVNIGYLYFMTFIPFIAIMLDLSLRLSIDRIDGRERYLFLLYLPVLPLEYLLLFSDKLVKGFVRFEGGVLRDPGPLYYLFETYVTLYLVAAIVNLAYGARSSRAPMLRTRNRLWLFGLSPMLLLMVYLIVGHHFGWTHLTSTFYVPIALSFFLLVTTYATHQYRLFDIDLYLPWSKVRARKTAFYGRIRAMIAEIADLDTVEVAVKRLADTLRCPVALIGAREPVFAGAGPRFSALAPEALKGFERITVANEIVDNRPDIYRIMHESGVAAVVPFNPHSKYASGWLLLGEAFSEQVYSKQDFKLVEELFDKMADLFLDKLVAMRTQLAGATRKIELLEQRQMALESEVTQLASRAAVLARDNERLMKLHPADSLLAPAAPSMNATPVVLLGRDKVLLKALRAAFPHVEQRASLGNVADHFSDAPLVVAPCDDTRARERVALLLARDDAPAVLAVGNDAAAFLHSHKREFAGKLIEALPADADATVAVHRAQALLALRQTYAGGLENAPLAGTSVAFQETIEQAKHFAQLDDAVLLRTGDFDEALALAGFMHAQSGRSGAWRVLSTRGLTDAELNCALDDGGAFARLLAEADGGTLFVADVGALPNEIANRLLEALYEKGTVRLIAACSSLVAADGVDLLAPFHPLTLTLPSLRERRADLALLTHYFTLQFNLRAGTQRYLTQTELDGLLEAYPATLADLKRALFTALSHARAGATENAPGAETAIDLALEAKSLDEHVAEFEARIIAATLERCAGNKSKAARLLGLRPNTLHYKLERYGIGTSVRRAAQ